jgi:SagB-type dehydrogenase family enzyme
MDHTQRTHHNRAFLKADPWREWYNIESDQKKGMPVPPVEKPVPEGAIVIDLPAPESLSPGQIFLAQAIRQRRSCRKYSMEPLSLEELSFLLWATQGVSKDENGNSILSGPSILRTVPSGGARHPFETYLLVRRVTGLPAGLYRYLPLEHQLVQLHTLEEIVAVLEDKEISRGWIGEAAVLFFWAAIPYRTEWRYNITAARLIATDAGHVCQNLYLACEGISAGMCAIGAYHQQEVDSILEVDGEDEFTVYMAAVGKKK